MQLFKLFGSVMVDNKKANNSLQKTDSLVSKLSKGLGSGLKTITKWSAGIVAGAGAGAAAMLGMAKNTAATGDRIDKLSQKMGLSRKGFQEWEYILSQNGASIEGLQGGMKKLNKTLDDAQLGGKNATEAFNRIGVSVDELKGLNPEQVFELTVKKLQEMPEGAEKAALANELLGKSGSELMPLLNGTAEGVENLKKQAQDMGLVLSDDAVDASAQFTDTIDNLERSFGSVIAKVGAQFLPLFQNLANIIIENMPLIQNIVDVAFKVIQDVVLTVVDVFKVYLLPTIMAVIDWVKNNWDTISQIISTSFNVIKEAIKIIVNIFNTILMPLFEYVINWIKNNWATISDVFKNVFNTCRMIIEAFVTVVQWIWDTFGSYILDYVSKVFNMIKGVISGVLTVIQGIIKTVTSVIRGDWKGAWEGIKQIFTGIWGTIKSYVTGAVDVVKSVISGAWGSIKKVTTSIWNGIKSAIETPINAAKNVVKSVIDTIKGFFNFKIRWPKIPMPHFSIKPKGWSIGDLLKGKLPSLGIDWYAKGGIFDKPTIFNTPYGLKGVGEAGPEAVAPISKLQEMIDWNKADNSGIEQKLDTMIELLSLLLGKDVSVYLDGKKISKSISPHMNKELARLREREVL